MGKQKKKQEESGKNVEQRKDYFFSKNTRTSLEQRKL